ncbi:DUF2255 domain-containing protein [Mangrovivirga cuniculi]|uniref:DUF2255 domain-containing protein n=2 Tax=Mangrovivirga cuniculi TaxID=2715131 RepID=A0A4D7JMK4_9BACT|nr:DUF2255 domain-containing protein [Mangrovivirga cuniculi]
MEINKQEISKEEVAKIAAHDDFHIAPFRADGKTYGTPTWIWVVSVDDQLFVRAYNSVNSRWYQSAMSQHAGKIEAAGLIKNVAFEPVIGEINEKIDEAYKNKYGGSPYLNAMISDRAKAATVKVL